MTVKTLHKSSSEVILSSIRDEVESNEFSTQPKRPTSNVGSSAAKTQMNHHQSLSPSVMKLWSSLPSSVRSALVSSELSSSSSSPSLVSSSVRSSNVTLQHSLSSSVGSPSVLSSADSNNSLQLLDAVESLPCRSFNEKCPTTGAKMSFTPLERAPDNVFSFSKTHERETTSVKKQSASTLVTTTTKVVTTGRGWRNVFSLPISYDVTMIAHGTLLDPVNSQLADATGNHPEGYDTRFAVIDEAVDQIYGNKIRQYFVERGLKLSTCVLSGGEVEKKPEAVDKLIDALCVYKLRRREPFLAIGGGVLLDIAGMAACLYRRGVPFVRVPTTLLAIVDASVGVKNGVDYCCDVTDETYKNRVGSFYAPSSCLLDPSFIETQDARNISNGFGEIVKLALVRSSDLFEMLESHGRELVDLRFKVDDVSEKGARSVLRSVSERIINSSIQIMLEELGPNLWEEKLERCVDYGHTFSKLLEMVPGADIMHGEAVNVDGFLCAVLSHIRGYISMDTIERVFKCMQSLSLPTNSRFLTSDLAWQSCKDAIEHRHGEQRIPLITDIGDSICVSDITEEELERAIEFMAKFSHEKEIRGILY